MTVGAEKRDPGRRVLSRLLLMEYQSVEAAGSGQRYRGSKQLRAAQGRRNGPRLWSACSSVIVDRSNGINSRGQLPALHTHTSPFAHEYTESLQISSLTRIAHGLSELEGLLRLRLTLQNSLTLCSQVNVPKTRRTYCKGKDCKKHTQHKVTR